MIRPTLSFVLIYFVIGIVVASYRAHKHPRFAVPFFDLAFWPFVVWVYLRVLLFGDVPFWGGPRR